MKMNLKCHLGPWTHSHINISTSTIYARKQNQSKENFDIRIKSKFYSNNYTILQDNSRMISCKKKHSSVINSI